MALGTKIVRGDFGVNIKIDMKEDMTAATGLNLEVELPKSGTIVNWTPTISGNFLQYTTVAGDTDEIGIYKVSPQLVKGAFDGRGLSVTFEVIDKYLPQ